MKRVRITKEGGGNYFTAPKTNLGFIDTGCTTLNLALGGGWAERRIANIVGDKSTGKTLLCIEACANFMIKYPKGRIKYREAESAFDKGYAEALGMPIDAIDFGGNQLETIEDMFEDVEAILEKSKGPVLYIVDSLDALSDRAEMERGIDESSYGTAKAKQLSQMFRRLVRKMEHKQMTMIIVSQVRDKIGAMFGRKTTRSGGRALDFYASHVVYLAHIGIIQRKAHGVSRPSGVNVRAKIDKNKVGLPFREADFPILFGYGVDDITSCLGYLNETGKLKEFGYVKDDIKKLSRELMLDTVDVMNDEHAILKKRVTRVWYDIERKLIPPRKKYGV